MKLLKSAGPLLPNEYAIMKEIIPDCLMPDEPFFVRAVVAFVISWNIHDNFNLL